MKIKQIEAKQRKIAKTLKTLVHPSNELAVHINTLYRELEEEKRLITISK